jgi:hypothetical protein
MEVRMYRKLVRILFIVFLLFPTLAQAVTTDDFLVKTTQNLINLCAASMTAGKRGNVVVLCFEPK